MKELSYAIVFAACLSLHGLQVIRATLDEHCPLFVREIVQFRERGSLGLGRIPAAFQLVTWAARHCVIVQFVAELFVFALREDVVSFGRLIGLKILEQVSLAVLALKSRSGPNVDALFQQSQWGLNLHQGHCQRLPLILV